MIDRSHQLSVSHQCLLLGLARSTAYYTLRAVSPEDLALMRRMDEMHLEHPFACAHLLRDLLRPEGFPAGRKHLWHPDGAHEDRSPLPEAQHLSSAAGG